MLVVEHVERPIRIGRTCTHPTYTPVEIALCCLYFSRERKVSDGALKRWTSISPHVNCLFSISSNFGRLIAQTLCNGQRAHASHRWNQNTTQVLRRMSLRSTSEG